MIRLMRLGQSFGQCVVKCCWAVRWVMGGEDSLSGVMKQSLQWSLA